MMALGTPGHLKVTGEMRDRDLKTSTAAPPAGRRQIWYWGVTSVLALECIVGGIMGALRLEPFLGVIRHLGYPDYFMIILGVSYVLAGLTLLAPAVPRLKEWAYAGLVFNYTGAAVSHVPPQDGLETLIAPLIFGVLTIASWSLRPTNRRDASRDGQGSPG